MLASVGRTDVSELIGHIKRETSKWMKSQGVANFYWQRGYGAFSIGQSQVEDVIKYIATQKEHHGRISYQEEFRSLCEKYEVPLDERYCWIDVRRLQRRPLITVS